MHLMLERKYAACSKSRDFVNCGNSPHTFAQGPIFSFGNQFVNHKSFKDYTSSEALRDGSTLYIRSIRPDDKDRLQDALHHLSPESQYFRFFTHKNSLSEDELVYFTELDFVDHVGLVGSIDESGESVPIAVARYIVDRKKTGEKAAEFAVVVDENYRRRGVATALFKQLISIARINGVKKFVGYVLPENWIMTQLIENSGLPVTRIINEAGVLEYTIMVDPVLTT